MKLAEALALRSDLQKRAAQLQVRLNNNARVQEREKPAENPQTLLAELDTIMAELEDLVTRINLTNSAPLPTGETITALLSRRDCLSKKTETLRNFLACASNLTSAPSGGRSGFTAPFRCRSCKSRWTPFPASCGSWTPASRA